MTEIITDNGQRRFSLDAITLQDHSGHFIPKYPFFTRGLFDRRNAVITLDYDEENLIESIDNQKQNLNYQNQSISHKSSYKNNRHSRRIRKISQHDYKDLFVNNKHHSQSRKRGASASPINEQQQLTLDDLADHIKAFETKFRRRSQLDQILDEYDSDLKKKITFLKEKLSRTSLTSMDDAERLAAKNRGKANQDKIRKNIENINCLVNDTFLDDFDSDYSINRRPSLFSRRYSDLSIKQTLKEDIKLTGECQHCTKDIKVKERGRKESTVSNNGSLTGNKFKFEHMKDMFHSDPKNFTSNVRRYSIVTTADGETFVRKSSNEVCRTCLTKDTLDLGSSWPYDDRYRAFLITNSPRRKFPLVSVFFAILKAHKKRFKFILKDNKITLDNLMIFLLKIEKLYQKVPYHNVDHAVDVLMATEVLLNQVESSKIGLNFTDHERFITLLAAACHDVGHPSVNNTFVSKQNSADKTFLTFVSPEGNGLLEKCHYRIAMKILKDCDLEDDMKKLGNHSNYFTELFNQLIMATDMSNHKDQMKGLTLLQEKVHKEIGNSSKFDRLKLNHMWNKSSNKIQSERFMLLGVILHLADLSNPLKQFQDAYEWALRVCREFYRQGDAERHLFGKVSIPTFDRVKTNVESCQIGFINFIVLPMVEAWCDFLGKSQDAQNMKSTLLENREMYLNKPNMTTICHRCEIPIHEDQDYVSAPGIGTYCEPCFKCDQCFQDFPNDIYFEAENKLYCKECFDCLYSPICAGCNLPITGKYKIAMGKKWHAECLVCSTCGIELWKDVNGFKQSPDGRALCNTHYEMERAMGFDKERCAFENCKKIVEKTEMIRYKNEAYHAYHFKCSECNCELDGSAKELKGKLFCLPCHDKQDDIHICSACHKPIDGRRIYALDAFWHVEHFVCTICQRPFLGKMHYEHQGQAYCEIHFKEIIGVRCFSCNKIITSEHVKALNKPWCTPCFRCSKCDCHLSLKEKITSIDGKPTCLKCWGQIPSEMKKRIKNGMGR